MEFFENLRPCLQACNAADSATRKNGESEIRNLRDQDTAKWLATLVRDVADETLDDGSRQMGCIILKNFITNRANDTKYIDFWVNLPTDMRDYMKEAILANLSSPKALVRSQIANVLAAIASIEIPRKEWDNLIPILCENSLSKENNKDIKTTSLTTLGYICEELSTDDLSANLKNNIVSALTQNISADPSLIAFTQIAIKALLNSIPFASQNFQIPGERDFIMEKIFLSCESSDEDVREHALHCLREICIQEYESLQFYFQKIAMITESAAKSEHSKVGAQAFEFWTTLAEEETERKMIGKNCHNYIDQSKDSLLILVLNGLHVINFEEDEDSDEWGHALSAACCLQKLAVLLGNHVMDPVVQYVSQNIILDSWKNKYAALMALGSITEGPEKQKFLEIIIQSLQNLMSMFQDKNGKVREAISWVMSRICEHHADVLTNPQVINQFVLCTIHGIKDKPRISNQCCGAIEKLAISVEPVDPNQRQNALTPFYNDLLTQLIINAKREDFHGTGVDLAQASYVAMTTLVQNSCLDSSQSTFELMMPILQTLEATLKPEIMGYDKASHLQDLVCGLLQVILIKVGHNVDQQMAASIIQLIIQLFNQADKVTENGLIAFQGLVVGLGPQMEISMMDKYIKHALESKDNDCVKLACGIISDLSGSMEERMGEYLHDFVPCLFDILKDNELDRRIKLPALHALGDLCMYCGEKFNQEYLRGTLSILGLAAQMSTSVDQYRNDQDTLDFMKELREEIIDQYVTILIAAGDTNCLEHFHTHLNQILVFIDTSLRIEGFSDPRILRMIIALVGDIATQFSKTSELKQLLTQPLIEQGILTLQQQPDSESKEQANYTLMAIKKLM